MKKNLFYQNLFQLKIRQKKNINGSIFFWRDKKLSRCLNLLYFLYEKHDNSVNELTQ